MEKTKIDKHLIKLTMGTGLYPEHPLETVNRLWAEKIYNDTDGRVHITVVDINSAYLGPGSDRSLMKKLDIALSPAFALPGIGKGRTIASALPAFFYGADLLCARKVFNELWQQFPEIRTEYTRVFFNEYWEKSLEMRPGYFGTKRLCAHGGTSSYISTKDRPIRTLNDLKGLRMWGGLGAGWLNKVGAIPKMVPELEVYPALKAGTLDGLIFFLPPSHVENMKSLTLPDVTKYSTNLHICPPPGDYYAIKMDIWNSFPQDIQKVFEASLPWLEAELEKSLQEQEQKAINSARAKGQEFIELIPEELKKLYSFLEEDALRDVAELDAQGLPGTKIFKETRRLVEEYNQ